MAKFKQYKVGLSQEIVIDLNNYLPAGHLCKQIENIVWDLDTQSIEAKYSNLGQNAHHPKMMLSIIFYGYCVGIRSGRELARACSERLPFIYISKNYRPQKSSINDFRSAHYLEFKELFLQVLKACQDVGLGDAQFSIVDGSKTKANSSRKRSKNRKEYEKWQECLLADIASLEQEAPKNDQEKKS